MVRGLGAVCLGRDMWFQMDKHLTCGIKFQCDAGLRVSSGSALFSILREGMHSHRTARSLLRLSQRLDGHRSELRREGSHTHTPDPHCSLALLTAEGCMLPHSLTSVSPPVEQDDDLPPRWLCRSHQKSHSRMGSRVSQAGIELCVARDDLELLNLLLYPSNVLVLWLQPRASCIPDKHSTSDTHAQL